MRWRHLTADSAEIDRLCQEAKLSPVLARLLILRGIKTAAAARTYLKPSLEQLHSPYQMRGMTVAIERLSSAITNKEQILIYGDYDVDGTTAVVILKTAIELCGGEADFHVPHRIKEGYGIKDDVIERAAAAGVKLVISVDTGIRAFTAADMDFIRQYRPRMNVVDRPTRDGGRGFVLTGHHELMFPLLVAAVREELTRQRP